VQAYYFSTQGCKRVESSLLSAAFALELLDAAAAAARALLLKNVEAMMFEWPVRAMQERSRYMNGDCFL
jgi:hypothetical protein